MKKKFLLIGLPLVALSIATLAYAALTWHTANQATIQWSAVTKLEDGTDVSANSVITYEVYMVNAITDPNKTKPVLVSGGAQCDGIVTQCVVTLNTEGQFYVGVKAIRTVNGTKVSESTMAWSDNPLYTNDLPFGMQYFLPPAVPSGLSQG